ncbi:MAG: 16S rRNA (cytosine(1402)-N(4))-methyltransferase RsmH [Holosporaceae bacterium]|jgi:16S rRNA (cytosine1402-N4)-methyltransferase|nr:16S rRNA (cytosine(1402)-N(4))-methyltransferase RsmH [Holosporaceae bacterium]
MRRNLKDDDPGKNSAAKAEHIPVLLKEMLSELSPADGKTYFDGTFGGGGYTKAILDAANCKVIAADRDPRVKSTADEFKTDYRERFNFFSAKFSEIKKIAGEAKLDGVVLDLGVSTFQLADPSRGFSFNLAGPVDMRMGSDGQTALSVIREYSERDLANIIYEYGEERFSRRIAKNIKVNLGLIKTTEDLANIIRRSARKTSKIDPATRTFQALRIFVNDELGELEKVLKDSVDLLNPGGKIVVASFHSLEDRIVKYFFKKLDPSKFKILTKKPIVPSEEEISFNHKSRSAKLRAVHML